MAYRKKYGDRLTAADMLQIDGTLQKNNDMMAGAAVAREIVNSTQSTVQPTDMNRLTNIIMGVESNGRRFAADGTLLQGPMTRYGTAKGEMQVLDGTAKDPGLGVRPAQDDSPAERARVGRDYLAALVKKYDGDVAKAAAAYNWGFGNVDKAVKAAQENAGKGEQVPPDAWLASAPAETRAYVAKVTKAMSDPRGGVPARPTLLDLQNAVRERLGPTASPLALKTALDGVEQQFTAQTKAIDQRKDELVAKAYEALSQNPRFTELPATLRAQLMQQAPDKVDELMNFGKRLSLGDDSTDDRIYLRLTTNPQLLGQMSDAQFYQLRGGLSQSDFQFFAKQRADIISGKSPNQAGDLNTGAVSRFADTRLRGIGIDPTPKDGTADAQRVGAIRRFIDASILDAQRQTGKKFSDAEVQQHVDALFAQNVQFRTSFLGIPTGTSSRQLLSMKPGDIPSADRDRITKAFKARGNDNPTDADILGAYLAGQAQRGRADLRTGSF
jgi:soluble lytic murein transglycosylase